MNSKTKEAQPQPSDALEAPLAEKLSKSSRLSLADSQLKSKSTLPQSHCADPPSTAKSNQVYLFFWHAYSPVMYALYKIDIPSRPPPPPAKASQDLTLSPLCPILTLETGKYADRMCCVQLGSTLYFFGGEFNITNPYISEDVIKTLEEKPRDVFPADVYLFDLANHPLYSDTLSGENDKDPLCNPMNSGKASPQAFVADGKIYVIGSTIQMNIIDKSKLKDLDLDSFAYFEVYDPVFDMWTILPNPPIRDMNTKWVGHAVVGKTALLVAWQRGKERVYFFDLGTLEWKKYASLPSYPGNFSGKIEYVQDTVYGCYGNTIAAIAPLAAEEEEEKEEEEEEEEEEGGGEEEEETEVVQSLLKHHGLHLVSVEMGMDAIFFNVPPQLQSSSSLLHLGNRYFCYVKTGMPPQMNGIDHAIEDDKRRFISIVIFQALGKTYKEDATRLFSAKFLHSAHYVVDNKFPSEGFIDGFFSPGLVYLDPLVSDTKSDTGSDVEDFILPELIGVEKRWVRVVEDVGDAMKSSEENITLDSKRELDEMKSMEKKEGGREKMAIEASPRRSSPDKSGRSSCTPEMEYLLGLLRIRVKRGFNLAIRDVCGSDPYVVIRMNRQKLKTRFIKKDVNPEWNEDLTLSVTDTNHPIQLAVYDHDTFSIDDKMGDAEFEIKSYIDALRMDLSGLPSGTIVSRIQPSRQNCLSEESCITWTEGKMIQDLCLRLRNVECGEVEIQLQWIDIPGSKGL